ncbi:MAG: hypothetical protein IPN18_14455 [Ignavibacteriales bacterium]|nr:hypothetical protein [Ignavibacteriales bacterium]
MRSFLIIIGMASSLLFSQWSELKISPFNGKINGFYLTDSLNITAVFPVTHVMLLKAATEAETGTSQRTFQKLKF